MDDTGTVETSEIEGGTTSAAAEEVEEISSETKDDEISEGGDDGSSASSSSTEETDETTEEGAEKKGKVEAKEDDELDISDIENDELDKKIKVDSVNFADLKKEYPDLVKKFPGLRHAIFRDREFTQLFGSVDDAKEAAQKVEVFDHVDRALMQGDPSVLVNVLNNDSAKDFAKNIIPTLFKRSPELADAALKGPVLNIIRRAQAQGKKLGDTQQGKNLVAAAKILHNMLFDTYGIQEHDDDVVDKRVKAEREQLSKKEQELYEERYNELFADTNEICTKKLSTMIESRLQGKENANLTPLMKKFIIKEVIREVGGVLDGDGQHMATMRALWKRAGKDGYSRSHLSQIATAYLGRARNLLGPYISKYKKEALGKGAVSGSGNGQNPQKVTTSPQVGSSPSGKSGKIDWKRVDWSKTSTADSLAGRVTYKK